MPSRISVCLLLVSLMVACAPRAGDPSLGFPPGGLDIHLHCQLPTQTCEGGVPCCELAGWTALTGAQATPAGALLSLEHFAVVSPDAGRPPNIPFQNESARLTHAQNPSVLWFSSLPCWHEQAWGPGWLARCSADVDAQLALGAKGFKDHVGKTFMHSAKVGDGLRWLGAWNRAQGHCVVAAGVASPNEACLEAAGARYPALEDDYRALVRHIVEDQQAVLVTHMRDFDSGPEQCLDPVQQVLRPCAEVMKDQVLSFAAWAEATLSPAARRRIVIAHLAFLQGEPDVLRQVLTAGLSVDTAAMITQLRHCEARALIAQFPDQLLWGTDAEARRRVPGADHGLVDAPAHRLDGRRAALHRHLRWRRHHQRARPEDREGEALQRGAPRACLRALRGRKRADAARVVSASRPSRRRHTSGVNLARLPEQVLAMRNR